MAGIFTYMVRNSSEKYTKINGTGKNLKFKHFMSSTGVYNSVLESNLGIKLYCDLKTKLT